MDADYQFFCRRCHTQSCKVNHQGNAYVCTHCKAAYPVRHQVIDFIYDWDDQRSLAQQAMEWPALVRIYESRLWRRNPVFEKFAKLSFNEEADTILSAVELVGDETILDLACGTGNYSRLFAKQLQTGKVIAADLSLPMLELAATRAEMHGLSDKIQFIRTSALELPLPDNSVDVVNCCGALHLFADLDVALNEIQRVLKPGGRFTTAVFRQQSGWLSRLFETLSRNYLGVEVFSLSGLVDKLQNVGLMHTQAYHDEGYWLILRSEKPAGGLF